MKKLFQPRARGKSYQYPKTSSKFKHSPVGNCRIHPRSRFSAPEFILFSAPELLISASKMHTLIKRSALRPSRIRFSTNMAIFNFTLKIIEGKNKKWSARAANGNTENMKI
jgi:hypothetical protein